MSEQAPVLPKELQQFERLEAENFYRHDEQGNKTDQVVGRHVYGVDEQGKKRHLKGDDVLTAYGHTLEEGAANYALKDVDSSTQVQSEFPQEYDFLHDEGAQKAFAEGYKGHKGGEEAYQAYVQDRLPKDYDPQTAAGLLGEVEKVIEAGQGKGPKAIEAGHQPKELLPGKTELPKAIDPNIEVSEDLQAELKAADDEYVRLRARADRRAFLTPWGKRKLEAAKQRRDEARNAAGADVARKAREQMQGLRISEEDIDKIIFQSGAVAAIVDNHDLFKRIGEAELAQSENKALVRFYDAWGRWGLGESILTKAGIKKMFSKEGISKMAKKALTLGVPGFLLGTAAAAAAPIVAGPVIGAGLAATAATIVSRRLMAMKVDKEADALRVAREKAVYRGENELERIDKAIDDAAVSGGYVEAGTVTAGTEARGKEDMKRNLVRNMGAAVIGAVAGAAGYLVGDAIFHHGGGKPENPGGRPNPPAPPEQPKGPNWTPHPTDNRYEWLYARDHFGGAEAATPMNMHYDDLLKASGFHIIGNNQGGGAGAYLEFGPPGGPIYTAANTPNFHGIVNYYHSLAQFLENQPQQNTL